MKKGFKVCIVIAMTVCMVILTGATALAHGGHGHGSHGGGGSRSSTRKAQYALCTVKGCAKTGVHQHGGTWYCCPSSCAGKYAVCTVDGCTKLGLHRHDGVYYYCQHHSTRR